ncbi:unnamed protein product [Paramecium primaurelia]|uniref:Uncharacterized protein n=1 Tax=Paramecium primaurelia TaxID=5886 RepID=A0A8S1P0V4_PARPR|nr:unnamed protein product [Paramecium primaurelia]
MQNVTMEKQINLLERDIQQKQQKIDELAKTVNQYQNFFEQAKTQIADLQDTQQHLHSQLFDIKQDRDNLRCINQIKEKEIKSLQEQVLVKNNIGDTQQLKHELQEQYNQILELKLELQTIRNQLEYSEIESQNLKHELKTKKINQVVYIQNEFNNTPLQIYNQQLDQFEEERKQYLKQIQQYSIYGEKIKIDSQKRIDKLQSNLNNSEEERQLLQEKLRTLEQMIEMYKQQAQEEINHQRIYEEQKLQNDREMRIIIEKKDKLISDQEKEIKRLNQRVSRQSPELIFSSINDQFNVNVDDLVDLKVKLMQQEKNIKSLQNQIEIEQQEKRNIQEKKNEELSIFIQEKQEYQKSKELAQQQKQKLEAEIQQNKSLRDEIIKLQSELTQLKCKDEIQRNEIYRLRQDNLNNKTSITQENKVQSVVKQSIINSDQTMFQEVIKYQNINLKQLEKLNQEILNLKLIINRQEEEIIKLQQKINNNDTDNDQDEQKNSQIIPIAKKIEKIRYQSKKQTQMLDNYRKLKLERNTLDFQIEEFKQEIQKLKNQVQLEKTQKEFIQKNFNNYIKELLNLEEQHKKQKIEYENKIKQIYQDKESNIIPIEQIDYCQQNKQLLEMKEKDNNLIKQLSEQIKVLNLGCQALKDEIKQKDGQIQQLQVNINKYELNQDILQMKLQIENDKIIIKTLNEKIQNLTQELQMKENELLSFQEDKLNWEQLQEFSRQIANENRSNQNNQEDINDLKKNLKGLQKQLSEQTQQYQNAIAEFGKDFQQMIMQQSSEIKSLEQENQELAKALEQYKQLYQQEKIDSQNRSDLTIEEIEEIKLRLENVTKERDQLFLIKDLIQEQEQFLKQKEHEIRSQEMELKEEQTNFAKKKQEIKDDILILKNKELSIFGCDYILRRQLEIYKQKLIEEQEKVKELMSRSNQYMGDFQEGNQYDLYEKKMMENQLNDLKKQIEQMRAEQLKLRMDSKIEIEEQYNFEEERLQYQQQIKQLMHVKENVTLEDVRLVRDIIQNGKLISYLEKAKQIHELQTSTQH